MKRKSSIFRTNLFYPARVFTCALIAFLIGTIAAAFLPLNLDVDRNPVYLFVAILILFSIFINFLLKNRYLTLICFCLLSFLGSLVYFDNFNRHQSDAQIPEDPAIGKIVSRPMEDATEQSFVISLVGQDKRKASVTTSIIPKYQYGDLVQISGEWVKTSQSSNKYDQLLHFQLIAFAIDRPVIQLQEPGPRSIVESFFRASFYFVSRFENSLNTILPEPHASLAAGLILGVKRNIPDSLMSAFQTVGLTHIIALSGYNISVILIIFTGFLVAYLGRRQIFLYGTVFALFFVFITGASQSIVRAAIISIILLFARTIGRRADQANLILFSAFVMVLINPYVITKDVGFQLSFAAFIGLVYLSEPIKLYFKKRKIPSLITNPLSETLSAQFAVFPLIFLYFRQISFISPLSNILVLWIVPLSMLLSFISGLVGIFSVTLGRYMAFISWPCLEYIIKVTEWLSKVPGAAIKL